jgi:hypothetical protein
MNDPILYVLLLWVGPFACGWIVGETLYTLKEILRELRRTHNDEGRQE